MDRDQIEQAVIAVLARIQKDGGLAPVPINPDTCPLEDLPGFTSKIAPVATSDLAKELGIEIPANENIFVASSGDRCLSVREVAAQVERFVRSVA